MKNNTIDAQLLTAQTAIDNALANDAIKSALALFGYDETKLNAGKSLSEDALALHAQQKREYGEQFTATDALDAALTTANTTYMRHVKVARVALKNERGASQALRLDGRRRKTYSGWLEQANVFYTNAQSDANIQAKLASFGMDAAALQAAQQLVKDVEAKLAAQLKEKGEAQAATQERDSVLEDLLDWMSDFRAIARVALEDQPQLLEILGIVEPS